MTTEWIKNCKYVFLTLRKWTDQWLLQGRVIKVKKIKKQNNHRSETCTEKQRRRNADIGLYKHLGHVKALGFQNRSSVYKTSREDCRREKTQDTTCLMKTLADPPDQVQLYELSRFAAFLKRWLTRPAAFASRYLDVSTASEDWGGKSAVCKLSPLLQVNLPPATGRRDTFNTQGTIP